MLLINYPLMKNYQYQMLEGYTKQPIMLMGVELSFIQFCLLFVINIVGFIYALIDIFQSCSDLRQKIIAILIAFTYWPLYFLLRVRFGGFCS